MTRLSIFALVLLTFVLAACGDQLSPSSPPTTTPPATSPVTSPISPVTGGQINVDDEFWYGSLSANGNSIPAGMGFLQTGSVVDGILAITGADGEIVTSPIMNGTLAGNRLVISFTDAVGDTGSVQGSFMSETTFTGTFTLTVGGQSQTVNITLTYQGPLGVQMQAQRVGSLKELAEMLE